MSMTKTFIIPEGPGAPNRLQALVRNRAVRMLEKGLQEADAALAAGKLDVATSKMRYMATEINVYLLAVANDVIGGNVK